ncbi:MAG: 6-bladed beta-propeller [Agriterribacter sp.]
MKLRLLTVCVVLLIAACNSSGNKIAIEKNDEIQINIPDNIDNSLLLHDDLFRVSNVVLVKPDSTHSESLISDIASVKKILQIDSIYVILDIKFRVVNAYNLKGQYLFTFNKLGVNKGGSSFPLDIVYDPQKRHIFIVSNTPNKLMEYSIEGHLIKEYPFPFFPSSMEIKSPNEYIFDVNFNFNSVSKTNNIIATDSTLEVQERFLTYADVGEVPSPLDQGGMFKPTDSSLYFIPAYSNSILVYKNQGFSSAFNIHFSTSPENELKEITQKNVNEMTHILLGHFFKNDSYIGINYVDKEKKDIYTTLYNYRNGKIYRSSFFNSNDVNNFWGYLFQSENKILLLVNVNEFYKRIRKKSSASSTESNAYSKIALELSSMQVDKNSAAIITLEII